jgi:6,7-dimethyl-8-ribityllumazine synthase
VFEVPGAVELTFAASQLIEASLYDAIIVFGCVIRGGAPHFDYVCQSVTQGITNLNADCDIPVIFGLLTVDNEQDALDRIGGPHGHKGIEAAETAIRMHHFVETVKNL